MEYVKNYIRNLLGLANEETVHRTSFKRDRNEESFCSDDDSPAFKKLKALRKSSFPDMFTNDDWSKPEKPATNVRYVPIQIDSGHPSTSTPNYNPSKSRVRTVPIKLVEADKVDSPVRKPRIHTPVRPVIHAVIDDDDDDDDEITWLDANPENKQSQNKPKVYIDLSEDEENEQPDNVILVKKIKSPPPTKPYKYFISKNDSSNRNGEPQYYKILNHRRTNDRIERSSSPKLYNKFKAPVGISKGYKKVPTPVPRWMQPLNTTNTSHARNRFLSLNSNARSAISDIFNLDEKRNYQELIKRVAGSSKPLNTTSEIINLTDSLQSTQRAQKKALDDIRFVEKGILSDIENEISKEYDPVTVASINSSDSEVEIIPSEGSTSSSLRINPVNSLRDSYKDKDVTANDWLAKLNSKYKKKRQDTQEKLKDARRENDIITKVNYEQKLAHLEHKLKYELSIPESLIEEPQPTVELPELTPEQEKLINRALGPGPPNQLLVEKFNLRIHRRDLQTLAGLNWLNDEVINFYMNLLMQRSEERKDLPKVYATNTFFYPKLMQSGQAGLRRWTRKVDIFSHDLMVIPVHLGVHWCLSLVDFKAKKIMYLDSMGGRNQACLDALHKYLHDEHLDKKGQAFDAAGWKLECLSKDIPQQMNGSDCGMFACTFAEFSSRNAPYSFSQQHMPYLRRKAALEILQGKLLL